MKALKLSLVVVPVVAAVALAGSALGGGATMAQAQAAGWDCGDPPETIFGYFHCTPPGKPSLGAAIGAGAPSITLRVYNDDASRTFAGTELLIRADLFDGHVPACPQDSLPEWGFLGVGPGYYACHRFDT
ncbi:MAG TPA: hypothetical protein VNJ53_08510 [Gaiellaceae bacterium]|nr:hypothetical protein [Gaiellaceae bacterium]